MSPSTRPLTLNDRLLNQDDLKAFSAQESDLLQQIRSLPPREAMAAKANKTMMDREAFLLTLEDFFESNPDIASVRFARDEDHENNGKLEDAYIFVEASHFDEDGEDDENLELSDEAGQTYLQSYLNDMGRKTHLELINSLIKADVISREDLQDLADQCVGADWWALREEKRLETALPEAADAAQTKRGARL